MCTAMALGMLIHSNWTYDLNQTLVSSTAGGVGTLIRFISSQVSDVPNSLCGYHVYIP